MKFNPKALYEKIKSFSIKRYIPHRLESIWLALLITFIVVNLFVFVWSFLLFIRVGDETVPEDVAADEIGGETLNRTELQHLIDLLEERQAAFESLTNSTIPAAAPAPEAEEGLEQNPENPDTTE